MNDDERKFFEKDYCLAPGPDGSGCILKPGHEGRHRFPLAWQNEEVYGKSEDGETR